ncbi:hypothetical protein AAG570_012345 [Ranatra chinensis]|uniref:Uncharacterized protein n=1 Tax=Ranatra chinensis TaxID=642074 RepID=A0ABD0Z4U6_9HEMI
MSCQNKKQETTEMGTIKEDGRYACASLCPKENIAPLGNSCRHPRLVEVPGQCCREWMCDSGSGRRLKIIPGPKKYSGGRAGGGAGGGAGGLYNNRGLPST